ncbi:MAG: ABC transporter permease [Phaeodactylibacter sp.]|nr:ABC transporter permease [Phaeodactylibacter sp.]
MLSNYFKIALRNLFKFKGYAGINILGLAIGLACCLLIVQYVRYEWSYDQHHRNGEDIYRVSTTFRVGERSEKTGTTPSPLAFAIKQDFPEVVESARVFKAPGVDKFVLKTGDRAFTEEKGVYADSTFFRLLTYDFVAGDPEHALDEPFSAVLSRRLAGKLFGNENPIGKVVDIESLWGEAPYTVTGVFDQDAHQSHIEANLYISSMSGDVGRRFYRLEEWGGNNLFYTYIQLRPGTSPKALEEKLPAWLEGYAGDRLRQLGFSKEHFLEPVGDIYLRPETSNPVGPVGSLSYLYILGSIAAFILFIACINFMNLATAKATVRAQEVGIRKVIGATRATLLKQFLSEALLYTCFAIVLAYAVANLALPVFNQLMGRELTANLVQDRVLLLVLLGFVLLTAGLAGGYPAAYLSSFSPTQIFQGNLGSQLSAQRVRKGLVAVQFVVSIALIQGILVIHQQMQYIRNKNLGFDKEQKIIIPYHSEASYANFTAFKNEILKEGLATAAGGTSSYPGSFNIEDMIMYGEGQVSEEGHHAFMTYIDPDYLRLMQFELAEGRFFDRNRIADTARATVINETLARGLGYTPESAVGKRMFFNWGEEQYSFRIIGVAKDFHASSLHRKIDGCAFFWDNREAHNFLVANVQMGRLDETTGRLEALWNRLNPDAPFEYYFLDEELQQNYLADRRMGGLVLWGTLLAIFVSCLGLLGLATFSAERRAREISVRKVLGATVANIVALLSKDFLRLVLIAFVLATPLAWYFMNGWLQEFEYHIAMPWWAFGLAGALSVAIAFAAIGWQALRAARANPAGALRSE